MALHVLDADVADFLNGLDDEYVYDLFDVRPELLLERCLVLCGNEEMYLLAYARAMVCRHFGDDGCSLEQIGEGVWKSRHHYEVGMGLGGVEFIKSVVKNENIAGRRRVFMIRGLRAGSQEALRHIIDRHDACFVIVGQPCAALASRAMVVRLPFEKGRLAAFLGRYGVGPPAPGRSVVSTVARLGKPRYERELDGLLAMMLGGGQADVARAIRAYCFRVHALCVPLARIGRALACALQDHPCVHDVVGACAGAEACGSELINYEQMLFGAWREVRKNSQQK